MRSTPAATSPTLMLEVRSISWWYWLVTVTFLTAGVSGWEPGFVCAIGMTVIQLVHFTIAEGSLGPFKVQVRLAYLLLLLIALPWNRRDPLSLSLLTRTYFSAPVRGSILQR